MSLETGTGEIPQDAEVLLAFSLDRYFHLPSLGHAKHARRRAGKLADRGACTGPANWPRPFYYYASTLAGDFQSVRTGGLTGRCNEHAAGAALELHIRRNVVLYLDLVIATIATKGP